MSSFEIIDAKELSHVDLHQGIILDVRTALEHAEKHIALDHVHVPLDQLNPSDFMKHHGLDEGSCIYILCRSGKRALQAAEKFAAAGYLNVKIIKDGLIACEECGHEIRGYGVLTKTPHELKSPLSLERQIRITAGLFIVIGL